jgi:hypothetical protein
MGKDANTVSYWIAPFVNRWDGTFRLDIGATQSVNAWVSGQPVADGDRIHLEPGAYVLAVACTLEAPVPAEVTMRPCFRISDDVPAEAAARRERIALDRDILEHAAKLIPDTPIGKTCARLLNEIK